MLSLTLQSNVWLSQAAVTILDISGKLYKNFKETKRQFHQNIALNGSRNHKIINQQWNINGPFHLRFCFNSLRGVYKNFHKLNFKLSLAITLDDVKENLTLFIKGQSKDHTIDFKLAEYFKKNWWKCLSLAANCLPGNWMQFF